jgi:hypothetical protein
MFLLTLNRDAVAETMVVAAVTTVAEEVEATATDTMSAEATEGAVTTTVALHELIATLQAAATTDTAEETATAVEEEVVATEEAMTVLPADHLRMLLVATPMLLHATLHVTLLVTLHLRAATTIAAVTTKRLSEPRCVYC